MCHVLYIVVVMLPCYNANDARIFKQNDSRFNAFLQVYALCIIIQFNVNCQQLGPIRSHLFMQCRKTRQVFDKIGIAKSGR